MVALPPIWYEEARRLWTVASGTARSRLECQSIDTTDPDEIAGALSWDYQQAHSPTDRFRSYYPDDFQLPEPFSGDPTHASVVVIGQNPGYDFAETIPRFKTEFEAYIRFYTERFVAAERLEEMPAKVTSGVRKQIAHYARIEKAVPPVKLGMTAVYVDAVPWKMDGPSLKRLETAWKNVGSPVNSRLQRLIAAAPSHRVTLVLGQLTARWCGLQEPSEQEPIVEITRAFRDRPALAILHPRRYTIPPQTQERLLAMLRGSS